MSKKTKATTAPTAPAQAEPMTQPTPPTTGGKRGVRVHAYPDNSVRVNVAPNATSRGADQAVRLAQVQAACKGGPLTVAELVAACPGGRRTLRRAWRAGMLVLA